MGTFVDMITVHWEAGERIRVVIDNNIEQKAAAMRQIFGDENVIVQRGTFLPQRSLREQKIALLLYRQALYLMETWVASVNENK